MAKGRSGRSGGHKSHGARKTGINGHRTHHHTSSRSAFPRRNHRTTTNHHTTNRVGVLRVSGGSSRNNPQTLLVLGGIFCLLAIGELIACLVLGVMVATCVKQPNQNNCSDYDSVLIPLGSTGGIFLVMGVVFMILSIRMIIQRKRAAAALAENGFANVSVMQLETGEPVAQQDPMMISNAIGYYGQPYVPNAVMMNNQYPPNNPTVILPNQQQPIYYYNQTNGVVNTDHQLGTLQNYNLSGLPTMNNLNNANIPNIPYHVSQQEESIPYSTNYANPTSDNEAIYIPSPQIHPPTQQQQLYHDNKV